MKLFNSNRVSELCQGKIFDIRLDNKILSTMDTFHFIHFTENNKLSHKSCEILQVQQYNNLVVLNLQYATVVCM